MLKGFDRSCQGGRMRPPLRVVDRAEQEAKEHPEQEAKEHPIR
jgi:hypothetical protein